MSLNFQNLPKFIKFKILLYLPFKNLTRVLRVNKSLYDISHNENFWYLKLLSDKPSHIHSKPITASNKEHYLLDMSKYLEYKAEQLTKLYNKLTRDNQLVSVDVPHDDDDHIPMCDDCGKDFYVTLGFIDSGEDKYVCRKCLQKQVLYVALKH